jgi:hypothetical protein
VFTSVRNRSASSGTNVEVDRRLALEQRAGEPLLTDHRDRGIMALARGRSPFLP